LNSNYPNLTLIRESICKVSPFQKKHVESYLNSQNDMFKEDAENFFKIFLGYIESQGYTVDYAAKAYDKLCKDILLEEVKFKKTGKYSMQDSSQAVSMVYSNEEFMRLYMFGLAISQFFWKNHYKIYKFFIEYLAHKTVVKNYLEIGPGHGLYMLEAIRSFKQAFCKGIDISEVSLNISSSIVKYFFPDRANISFERVDILGYDKKGVYDFIVMGEVLEHVQDPIGLLEKVNQFLDHDGEVFITTCANCPAIDHIYLYNDAEHIRTHIRKSGFKIISELLLPVIDPQEKLYDEKTSINYAAILQK